MKRRESKPPVKSVASRKYLYTSKLSFSAFVFF
jgi:hypothetical protein